MLGNEENARFIRDWYVEARGGESNSWRRWEDEPEGWTYLNHGVSRAAYLGPDGVVYKVQHYYGRDASYYLGQSNSGEAETLRKHFLTKLPKGCRLPRFTYYELDGRGVMVMEYFRKLFNQVITSHKEYGKYASPLDDLRRTLRLEDLYGANLAVDTERELLVPIDLGC